MDLSILGWGDAGWGDEFARAALMTFAVAVCAFLLGIVFGTIFAAFKLSSSRILRWIGDVYTTVIRGIPELLVIYLIFFGGGALLRSIANALFGYDGYIDLPVFGVGVLCIGLSAGAYCTEVIRGAVLAVPRGQIEAGMAIGMGKWLRFWRILVPQTARYALRIGECLAVLSQGHLAYFHRRSSRSDAYGGARCRLNQTTVYVLPHCILYFPSSRHHLAARVQLRGTMG